MRDAWAIGCEDQWIARFRAMHLTHKFRNQLLQDGYVQFPAVVPSELLRRALRGINASLGKGMNASEMQTFSAQSFCPDLRATLLITDLFNRTALLHVADEAIGTGRIEPVAHGQIALRFPCDPFETSPSPPHAHLDGMYTPTNGVRKGTVFNFTALIGVLLSDAESQDAGNFTVWPGSHLKHAEYFRARGPQSLIDGMPRIDIGPPRQLTGRAGDAIFAHYLLGHGVAANLSAHIRYACFFRLIVRDHEQTRWDSMCDPWLQWHGMRGTNKSSRSNVV